MMDRGKEILLKAELLVEGVQIADSAFQNVGKEYKEQVHHLFEYDFDLHTGSVSPAEMRLPGGSVVQVRLNGHSPFLVEAQEGTLILKKADREVTTLQWLERPTFYDLRTVEGTAMPRIAELVGEDCLSVCHTNACATFSNGQQCAFCNLNPTPKRYEAVLMSKRAAEVGQVAAAAFREGVARHFTITGGILKGDQEMHLLEAYLKAFREATGLTEIPGYVIPSPPEEFGWIERLHQLGIKGIGFNLECWDRDFFRAVCPGKEARIGWHRYREALRAAVEIFGPGGRVFSGFVAGIEPMASLLEGIQELAEEGIASIPLVWSPSPETRFHGHRPPYAEWYVELSERATTLMIRHLKREPQASGEEPLRCVRCQTYCLIQDILQAKLQLLKVVATGQADGLC